MAFVVPTFNLSANIWRHGNATTNPPDVVTPCNLALGRRAGLDVPIDFYGSTPRGLMWLLLPRGTDIRDSKASGGEDTVEVPASSHRFYLVKWVDDIGGGFSNEHRFAMIDGSAGWPTPFPSPAGPFPPPPVAPIVFAGAGGGIYPTTFNLLSWNPFAGSYLIIVGLWLAGTSGPTISGATVIPGTFNGVSSSPPIACQAWYISGAGAGGSRSVSFSGGPSSRPFAYFCIGILPAVTVIESDTWVNGSGTPSHTPSGWTGPPTFPAVEIPIVIFDGFTAGGQTFGSPYGSLALGNTGSVFSVVEGVIAGYYSPTSLTYPPWAMSGGPGGAWAGGTIFAG